MGDTQFIVYLSSYTLTAMFLLFALVKCACIIAYRVGEARGQDRGIERGYEIGYETRLVHEREGEPPSMRNSQYSASRDNGK